MAQAVDARIGFNGSGEVRGLANDILENEVPDFGGENRE